MSGEDLSWFWNAFFYGTDVLDIAVDGVSMRHSSGQSLVEDRSCAASRAFRFPVTMRLKFNDASTQDVRLPVEIWSHGDRYKATIPVSRPVVGVRLWPDPQRSRLECGERRLGRRVRRLIVSRSRRAAESFRQFQQARARAQT